MKVVLFANTDWYLYNFRRSLALALRQRGLDVLLVSPPGPYGPKLEELGFRWIPAPMHRRSLNLLRELALINWLRRLMARERVDLVHCFTVKCAIYGSLAARLAGVPARINAVAGLGYVFTSKDRKAGLLRPLVCLLFRLALAGRDVRLILQNEDDASVFKAERLFPPSRTRLIPGSGVDCLRFSPPEQDPCERPSRVLLAARLLWDKGVSEYVEAARWVHSRMPGAAVFLLAGQPDAGNPAAIPQEQLVRWQNEGVIEWMGHVEDMPGLFRSVDITVLPSYREGLPRSLAEAAACGLPLVTTDVPGCREVVTDGVDGLVVPVRDPRALAAAICRLLQDPGLRRQLGNAARDRALRTFDEKIIVEQTLSVYRELAVLP